MMKILPIYLFIVFYGVLSSCGKPEVKAEVDPYNIYVYNMIGEELTDVRVGSNKSKFSIGVLPNKIFKSVVYTQVKIDKTQFEVAYTDSKGKEWKKLIPFEENYGGKVIIVEIFKDKSTVKVLSEKDADKYQEKLP